jgi:hypothetical protein
MNVRSRKPAASGASARANTTETSSSTYMAISSVRYGTTDVTMSSTVRKRLGVAYDATATFHGDRAPPIGSTCTPAAFIGLALARSNVATPRAARPSPIVATLRTLTRQSWPACMAAFANGSQAPPLEMSRPSGWHARDEDPFTGRLVEWPLVPHVAACMWTAGRTSLWISFPYLTLDRRAASGARRPPGCRANASSSRSACLRGDLRQR